MIVAKVLFFEDLENFLEFVRLLLVAHVIVLGRLWNPGIHLERVELKLVPQGGERPIQIITNQL